jgi:hypothetical protein
MEQTKQIGNPVHCLACARCWIQFNQRAMSVPHCYPTLLFTTEPIGAQAIARSVVFQLFIDENELISKEILANECLECIIMDLVAHILAVSGVCAQYSL